MAINPVRFAQHVNEQLLRYQLTAFPITDPDLAEQAQQMLRGRVESPLVKGPYVSLSKSFKFGPTLQELADRGTVHPALPGIALYESMFAHQWETLKAVLDGRHCLVSTGTGSGKTESFLYPIIDHCLRLRDANESDGIVAIIVYPMIALAMDQLERLRGLLAGTGVTFGMYIGSTPSDETDATNYQRLPQGQGRAEWEKCVKQLDDRSDTIVSPWEERVTEAEMRERPPRLLLTNVHQLEFLLTRGKDLQMFRDAPLRFLVFDEAHTYAGVSGAETACLIRRIRAYCRKSCDDVICIGTSATLTDPETGEAAGAKFAQRFFGVDPERVSLIEEEYEDVEWPQERVNAAPPETDAGDLLDATLQAVEADDAEGLSSAYSALTGQSLPTGDDIYDQLYQGLQRNEMAYQICDLAKARPLVEAVDMIWRRLKREEDHSEQAQSELLCHLALGAAARRDGNPLMRPKLHYFVRGLEGAAVVFPDDNDEPRLYMSAERALDKFPTRQPTSVFPVWVCRTCGQHFSRSWVDDLRFDGTQAIGGQAEGENVVWPPTPEDQGTRLTFTNRYISELAEEDEEGAVDDRTRELLDRRRTELHVCRHCGALHRNHDTECSHGPCKRGDALVPVYVVTTEADVMRCPTCGERGRRYGGDRVREPIRPLRATTVADMHILAQDILNAVRPPHQKLICFADNQQDAAFQAGWMQDHARRYRLRHLHAA